jgi:adenosylcobinamide kinase/adenosylcobinamide-phosphate guanylyltransferase
MKNKITFIVGGARSGKSEYALKLAAKAKNTAFIATCQALDAEMEERIRLHKVSRPKYWTTYEEPLEVAAVIKKICSSRDTVLIDCITLLVTNLLLKKKTSKQIEGEIASIMDALKARKGSSVIVSNEVGLGIVPDNKLGRDFRDIAGKVNKIIAAGSTCAFFMVSGIPWRIK